MNDLSKSLDTCAAYMVVIEESGLALLESILQEFRRHTKQESIYLEVLRAVEVRFIE